MSDTAFKLIEMEEYRIWESKNSKIQKRKKIKMVY